MRFLIVTLALVAVAGASHALPVPDLPPVGTGDVGLTCTGTLDAGVSFVNGEPGVSYSVPDCAVGGL